MHCVSVRQTDGTWGAVNRRRRSSRLEEGVHDAEGGEEEEVGEDDERQADGEEHAVTQHDAEAPQREEVKVPVPVHLKRRVTPRHASIRPSVRSSFPYI